MTCENNIMGSKNKSTKSILLSLGVWMMISYGTFGMKTNHDAIKSVLDCEILSNALGKNKEFKELIKNIGKKDGYQVKYEGCCCFRGDICNAKISKFDGENSFYNMPVSDLIYSSLDVDDNNGVKITNQLENQNPTMTTGIYNYLRDQEGVSALNDAIKEQQKKLKKKEKKKNKAKKK